MDSTLSASSYKRRKGQTLVEFGLILPILLLMIFGIIEFGRIFQAWVSLQNAARAAARFASTGAVNYDIFAINDDGSAVDLQVLNQFVPCDVNDNNGGNIYADIGLPKAGPNGVTLYEDGVDGLFATWYDGTDCDPTLEDHTTLRKDMLRIASIMFEARESVNALSVEGRIVGGRDSHYFKDLSPEDFKTLLYNVFATELPRHDQRGWFDVQMCSSRGLLDPVAPTAGNPRTLNEDLPQSRFVTVRGASDLGGVPDGVDIPVYEAPYCMLNEIPPPAMNGGASTAVNNSGVRWLDAGGAGDRVTILVTFNHPLITPLRTGVENFLTMQSRRSIVNESFRAPKAIGAFQRSLPPGSGGVGTLAPSLTPSATDTPSETPTNTPLPTLTATDTPEPFSCDNINMIWGSPPFEANRMFVIISNGNMDETQLKRVVISWGDLADPYHNMYLGAMSLYSDLHWTQGLAGNDNSVPGQTSVDTGVLSMGYRIITAQSDAVWEAIFFSGPSSLADYMTLYDFSAQFTFTAPDGMPDCVITLDNPPGGEPTEPIDPTIGPSPTNTPNCATATNRITLEFGGFGSFGGVYLVLTNNSGRDLVMTGFDFVWPGDTHPDINEPAGGYRLAAVKLGGEDVLTSTETLWSAQAPLVKLGNTKTGPPYNNRTLSNAVGTWHSNGTLPPGATKIWMDFDSVPGSMYDFNARPWHFDTSKIKIACYGSGGSGGGGDSDEGDIDIPVPSPTASKTPKPTNTKGPTNTSAPATKTWTATQTKTKAPPTLTYTPKAPTFTPSRTPIGQPTVPDDGGGE